MLSMMLGRAKRSVLAAMTGALMVMSAPIAAGAHSELVSSTIEDGEVIEVSADKPFRQRVVLTFSGPLAEGSTATWFNVSGIVDDNGVLQTNVPTFGATVDGPAGTMTLPNEDLIASTTRAGTSRIDWTSVSEDGHVLKGSIHFELILAIPSTAPTRAPSPAAAASEPSAPASAVSAANPTPDAGATSGSSGVVIPLVVALLVAAVGGAYLLTRRAKRV
jgi:methionine-rich copper-binding protein CopC